MGPRSEPAARDLTFSRGACCVLTPRTGTHSTACAGSHHSGTRTHTRRAATHTGATVHTAGTHACAACGRYGG
ncbi:hypothetical protein AFE_2051 [Acidithiobacillus ferrooxidans ATCC 23270]|uniref:Uncharacterized protein n=1 Tax=Acidithiobacillus ferrooxidans (strain ATCC 23270 / DSM 14882 / CIP 104768 / NCIMB 8455) TaxID=243159 RepID=B7J4R2_ACIF2|nr:hypothetical protein AFE_2051 [Acidithiobacillus ferrooxidans ATCC 23270]